MTKFAFPVIDRRHFMLGTAGLGFAAAMAPGALWAQTPRSGTLQYATLGLDTSDPHRHTGSIGVQQAYVEALTSIGVDGSVVPWLSESIDVDDDGLVYTFKLRPNVKYHDGETLKAADVVANVERVKNNIKGGWLVTAMGYVEKVEAPDDLSVVITMKQPYSPLLSLLSELWIVSPKSDGWDSTITLPIGTGPFKFGSWQPKVSFTAPAFDSYWVPGLPLVETVQFDLRDQADKSLALQAGDLHIAMVEVEPAEVLAGTGLAKIMPLRDTSWYSVGFNNRTPKAPFDDIRVRQAIAHSVDKAAFMQFQGGANAVAANQMAAPGNFYFDQAMDDADPFKTPDLDKAKALLADAGVNPADHTIRFVSWQEDYAQVIVQSIRKLGFNVDHSALDDVGAQQRLGGDDWDVNVMSSGPRADIYLRYVRLITGGPNPTLWGNISDKELDALVEEASKEPDQDDRKALYLKAMQLVQDKMYFVVLGHAPQLIAVRNEIEGYEPGFTWSCNWAGGGVAHTSIKS